ncbi:MAG: YigZ family protein [Clostridiales bacterium]|nr:YigZ family protein [Clostridiales bacterium]
MNLYKTVTGEGYAEQIIEKSRFIAHVKPVSTREEGDAFVAEIKSRYKDATHNVPAMVIGDKFQMQWASDDGEPQGTSGAPIVQMLVKEELTNLVVVVTRYFGGVKLGTGGLVRAYTSSAKLGLQAAGICSVKEVWDLDMLIDYSHLAKLQNLESKDIDSGFAIVDTQYTDKVLLTVRTLTENLDDVKQIFANITGGTSVLKCSQQKKCSV